MLILLSGLVLQPKEKLWAYFWQYNKNCKRKLQIQDEVQKLFKNEYFALQGQPLM